MRLRLRYVLLATGLLVTPGLGAELEPDSGAVSFVGVLQSADGDGEFRVDATLADGDFTGQALVSIAGQQLDAGLIEARSYLENGKCHLYLEQGRSRFEMRGRCDDQFYGSDGSGSFEAFFDGGLQLRGDLTGSVTLAGVVPAPQRVEAVSIPTGKLSCAWQEVHVSAEAGVANDYQLAYSMLVTLTLAADGTYRTASDSGTYAVAAEKLLLTSGAFAGAVGTLEPDRSGRPAVVFHKDENRGPDGVPRIDPETTRCTQGN